MIHFTFSLQLMGVFLSQAVYSSMPDKPLLGYSTIAAFLSACLIMNHKDISVSAFVVGVKSNFIWRYRGSGGRG